MRASAGRVGRGCRPWQQSSARTCCFSEAPCGLYKKLDMCEKSQQDACDCSSVDEIACAAHTQRKLPVAKHAATAGQQRDA